MQSLWSCLKRLHRVDGDLTQANRNVTCSNRYEKRKGLRTSHSNPGPVSSSAQCFVFIQDKMVMMTAVEEKLNYSLGYWILISKSDMLYMCVYVCVCVCYGSLQQNSISCLHLSRLIILRSISFKLKTSLFCLFFFPIPGQPVDIAQLFFTGHTLFSPPTCFNSL